MLEKYALVQLPTWRYPAWMRDDGDWWRNESGGGFPKDMTVTIHERAEVADYLELDHKKTGVWLSIEKKTRDGWLSPAGEWHPCGYENHDNYAYLILKRSRGELEAAGWALCRGGNRKGDDAFFYLDTDKGRRLTAEQRNKLSRLGFRVEDWQ